MSPRPSKPEALPVLPDYIPAGMQARPQWVGWKYELIPSKTKPWTKVPYSPKHGRKANHSDPSTWGTFEEAHGQFLKGGFDGIGYVFSKDDPYCGIDLDECRTPEDGTIEPEKRRYVDQMASYTEVSPSGTGLHIIIEGQLPGGGRKDSKHRIEVYDQQRFFCFTGHTFDGAPADPQTRQAELECFYDEIFGPKKTQPKCSSEPDTSFLTVDEQKIIDEAIANTKNGEKIRLLFDGQFKEAGYPSQSEADLALCNYLATWFNRDRVAVDKAFRASKLYRPKWDEKHSSNGTPTANLQFRRPLKRYQRAAVPLQANPPISRASPWTSLGNQPSPAGLRGPRALAPKPSRPSPGTRRIGLGLM